MSKLSFLAGVAVGYVLGAKAGQQRYEQIKSTSTKVWNSEPVQKQVDVAKEAARTKAAPAVADMVSDAAKATGEKLRAAKTVPSQLRHSKEEPKTGPIEPLGERPLEPTEAPAESSEFDVEPLPGAEASHVTPAAAEGKAAGPGRA